jgi:diaminopimelate decarboxylase
LWPIIGHMSNIHNGFRIQDVSVDELARQYGTPLYVYDGQKIAKQIDALTNAFAPVKHKIKYAVKALTNLAVLKLVRGCGIGADVVSIFEAQLALKAGFQPTEIMFTPNGVAFSEIQEGVGLGLLINVDNLPALEKFGQVYGNTYPCGLRLNPHIMAGGNLKISTGHKHSKFGISIEQLAEIIAVVQKYNINIQNLHIHTGSEITDIDVYLKMADVLFETANQFPTLKAIDFGGGFKVRYKDGDKITDIGKLGSELSSRFNAYCKQANRDLELWIEPGKFLVSEAGYLITKANVVKETPSITFVGVDTGLNHLIRPMMYDAYHEIINGTNTTGEKKTYNIVGNICETDTLGAARELNTVTEGDLIVIKNAGAYGFSMASNYNSRPRPAEVLIENGKARLIRQRESLEDLWRGQIF